MDGIYPGDPRGIAVLDDREQDRTPSVVAHDVLLDQPTVVNLTDVPDEDSCTVNPLDRNIVEVIDRRRRGVGANDILRIAELCRARRQRQALRIDRIDDVETRQPLGQQFHGIDMAYDLAVLSARRRRQRNAGYGRELLTDAVDAVIIELLLAQRVGG